MFRVTKGKALAYFQQIDQDDLDIQDENAPDLRKTRAVYIIINAGGSNIKDRLTRICDTFEGTRVAVPSLNSIDQEISRVRLDIIDAQQVFDRTKVGIRN